VTTASFLLFAAVHTVATVQQVAGSTLDLDNGSPECRSASFCPVAADSTAQRPSRPVTPLPGPVTDICLPYSLEVPRLTRQRICPLSEALVAVSSVTHMCIFTAFQCFLQHQGQLPTSFQQSQASPPPTFMLRYFCVGFRLVQCREYFHSQP
jgi:hypothetical protein